MRDCLRLVAELKDRDAIATELGIARGTVDSYLAEARKILGTGSSREAARMMLTEPSPPSLMGGDFTGVEDVPASPPPSIPQQDGNLHAAGHRWGISFSALTPIKRLAIIGIGSIVIALGIGVAVIAVVGLIALYESVPRGQ